MLQSQFPATHQRIAPFSTGWIPRTCRVCGATFTGLGTLCPTHLAAQAKTRGAQIQRERAHSAQIISVREIQNARARVEWRDELDA